MNNKRLIWAAVGLVLIGDIFLTRCGPGPQNSANAIEDKTVTAFIGDLSESVTASGQVLPQHEAALSAAAPGRVEAVNVHIGDTIQAEAASEELADTAVDQVTDTLRDPHGITYSGEDDFSIFSQTDLLETVDTITSTLTAFLGAIAGISLLVGGIGIMNIMLVSVTERTREIGIRKAVGALKRDILSQFLLESTFRSIVGGLLGILLGWIIARIIGNFLEIATIIDIGTIALATGFAAGVGLVFGIYPAWRAAGLRPIEALRYE